MIHTETKSAELPPGWQWHYRDSKNRSFVAEKPGHIFRSPGFPDEAQTAPWAQMKEESLKEDSVVAETPTLESALYRALQSVCPPKTGWEPLKQSGVTDAELQEAIGEPLAPAGQSIPATATRAGSARSLSSR